LGSHESSQVHTAPRARRDLILQEVGDEGLLYDREGGLVHILNLTALCAWRLCDGSRSVEQIARGVEESFRSTEGVDVRRDVEEIITRFAKRGLLERS